MKKFFTVRNILIMGATFFAALTLLFSLVASARVTAYGFHGPNDNFPTTITFYNFIWGCDKYFETNVMYGIGTYPLNSAFRSVGPVAFGVVLVVLSAGLATVSTLVIKNEKLKKVLILVAAGLMLLGGILHFFVRGAFVENVARYYGYSIETVNSMIVPGSAHYGLPIVGGVISVLGSGAVCTSAFLNK